MANLRAGVLGLGIGKQHALAYHHHPDVELVALCDMNTRQMSGFCAENQLDVHCYASYADMLESEHLDIVSLCTPDHLHAEHLLPALKAGCHVMQEKPLATSMDDARQMVEAVARSGKIVMLNHIYRQDPVFRAAERLCTTGGMGTLLYLESDFLSNKHRQYDAAPWHLHEPYVRHPLVGTGCHNVDLLRAIAGDVEEVAAMGSNLAYPDYAADDIFVAMLHFKSGAIGKITISCSGTRPKGDPCPSLQVLGTKGMIQNNQLYIGGEQEGVWGTLTTEAREPLLRTSIGRFVECVLTGQQAKINVHEGAKNLAVCLAGVESRKTGKAVRPAQL
jgi:UDP-N-acetylglucosamine 3-dehydrogenase